MRPCLLAAVCLLLPFAYVAAPSYAQLSGSADSERVARHQSADWVAMEGHLPDPATASPASLQLAADVMRARRLPEDALDYYRFALERGGDVGRLTNRMGITLLELHHPELARTAFQRAVHLAPRDPDAWNNLAASEYVAGDFPRAIGDYRRAVKLNKNKATFHANLGTAYFEVKDYDSARKQFAMALKLDPNALQGGGSSGIEAHVLSPSDRGRFCFEMAKLAARDHDVDSMLRWLARATEVGFDTQSEMGQDRVLRAYLGDPRVVLMTHNAKAMRNGQIADLALMPALQDAKL